MESQQKNDRDATSNQTHMPAGASESIDWYHEGEERVVETNGVQVVVRFVGRNGRRGRIAITAPPGAVFQSRDRNKVPRSANRSF
jgi:hypothetical protein